MENINGGFMMNFIRNLQFIFKPHYWMMNNPYNEEWDKKLNQLMDKYPVEFGPRNSIDGAIHTVSFDGNLVWVENYPYSFATPHSYARDIDVRPSRLTIQRLYNLVSNEKHKVVYNRNPLAEYFEKVNESLYEEHK
jgi:hypothetical protein